MPAKSKVMRRAAAIAEHSPGKLFGRNKSLLKMGKSELHKIASTPEKGLPKRKKKPESVDAFIKRRNAKEKKRG